MSSGEKERSSGSGSSSPRHQTSESNSSGSMQVSMSPGEEQKRSNSRSCSGSGSGSSSPSNCGSSENGSSGSHVSGGGSSKSHHSKGSNADSSGSHSSGGGSTSTGNSDGQHSDGTTSSNSTAPQPRSEPQQQQRGQEQTPCFPGSVRLIPRQRFAFNSPIVYTYDMLKARFHLRLHDAAKSLSISETTLKHVCRKLGVSRWPRRFQNRNFAEPEGASAPARGADPRGSANCNDDDSDDVAPHASEKRKAGQSTPSSLQPRLPHHTSAQVPHVPSFFQQQSMASHQLLATRRQTAAGRQGFTAGVHGAVVGVQMPSLSGREGFGSAAAGAAWRVDTGVSDTLFSCIGTVASSRLNAADAHVDVLAGAGAGPSVSRDRNHLNIFGGAGAATLPVLSLAAPASPRRENLSSESSKRTQSRDLQGRTDAPALNAHWQAHITKEKAKGASLSEVDYHLDLQALDEHTAFPPLSALLAQEGGGDY